MQLPHLIYLMSAQFTFSVAPKVQLPIIFKLITPS